MRGRSLLLGALLLLGSARASNDAGSAAAELDRRAQRLARAADQLDALADLYALVELRPHLSAPASVDALFERTAGARAAHPIVRDHARALAAEAARRRGDDVRARALLASTGQVSQALLLGPFDNTGGALFGAGAIDERRVDLRASHVGVARELTWRPVASGGAQGYLDLGAQIDPSQGSLVYLLFMVSADRPSEIALRVGSADQVCVRVGNAEARCFDERHPWSFEQHAVGARLPRGTTPVLLRLGHVDGRFRTSIRLTRPDGGSLDPGVTVSLPGLDQVVALDTAEVTPLRGVADLGAVLVARARRGRGAARAARLARSAEVLWALRAFDQRREPSPVIELLDEASAHAPETGARALLRGVALAETDSNAAREALRRAADAPDPPARALLALARQRLDLQRYDEAHALLLRAVTLDPDDPELVVALADALIGLDPDPGAGERVVEDYLSRHGVSLQPAALDSAGQGGAAARRYLSQLRSQRRFREVRLLAEALYAADRTDAYALRTLLGEDRRAGDVQEVIARLDALVALAPQSRTPRLERARHLAWNGEAEAAALELEYLRRSYPDHADVAEAHGEALLLAGRTEAAAQAWRQSLRLRPQQPELARRVDALALAPDPLERYTLDLEALRAAPTPAEAAPFGLYVLGHTIATRLYDNGLSSTVEDFAVRLLDRDFAEAIRTRRLYYSSGREQVTVLVAERIDRRGRSYPPESIRELGSGGGAGGVYSDRSAKEIRFGALEVGDIVRVRARTDAVGQVNLFGDFYGQVVAAQGSWPVRRFDFFVEAPTSRPLYLGTSGLRREVVEPEDAAALRRYHLFGEALPGRPLEPNMPPLFELVPHLSVSTYASWDELLRWYADLIAGQYRLDEETRAVARQLVAGVDDPREKVRRVHDYVVKKTRYVGIELGIHGWKPYQATLVHRRGYGDCKDKATLLVAMLEAVGVAAELVLVRTANLGELAPDPPTMWAFNHAIAYVPELELYLDGTAEFSGLDELPDLDQGTLALRVGRDGRGALVRPPLAKPEHNLNRSDYVVHLDELGAARLAGTERFRGARASQLRRRFADPATRREQLEKDLSDAFPSAHVEQVVFSDLAALGAEVSYSFEARVPRRAQATAEGLVLPISLYPHELARAFTPSQQRHYDLVLARRWRTHNVMRYVLPPGYSAQRLPPPVVLDTPHLLFEQRVERRPDGFVVDELTEWRSRRVPRADYPALRQACLDADAAMQRRLSLVRLEVAR